MVALAVAGAAAGYGFSVAQSPLYRSSAKLYVMPARPDQGITYFSQNVVRQYGQLIVSDQLLRNVSQALQLGMSPGQLRGMVTASGNVENLIIYLTVDDTDPRRAQGIAQQLVQEFIRDQEDRMDAISPAYRVDVRAYDDATPAGLFRPLTRANTAAAGFLGLLLGVTLVFFLELFDDTIKTPEDVDRYVGAPILGYIPAVS